MNPQGHLAKLKYQFVMKLLCVKCWNTGVIKERVRISNHELEPIDRAEVLVNGGYAYRVVERFCPCGRV